MIAYMVVPLGGSASQFEIGAVSFTRRAFHQRCDAIRQSFQLRSFHKRLRLSGGPARRIGRREKLFRHVKQRIMIFCENAPEAIALICDAH
jgi:hypothetical protein